MKKGEQITISINEDKKIIGSGFIYKTLSKDFDYIFTAKHCVCGEDPAKCKSKTKSKICDDCQLKKIDTEKISLSFHNSFENNFITPEDYFLFNYDLCILKVAKIQHIEIPEIKIAEFEDDLFSNFISYGFPRFSNNEFDIVPFKERPFLNKDDKIWLELDKNIQPNLDGSIQDNQKGLSGAALIGEFEKEELILGVYTDTKASSGYAIPFKRDINCILEEKWQEPVVFINPHQYIFSKYTKEFLSCFDEINHSFEIENITKLNLFCIKLNDSYLFEDELIKQLVESIQFYSLSRKHYFEMQDREKLKESDKVFKTVNKENRIPDLLLYNFLEAHKQAPKIFSRAENENKNFSSIHYHYTGKEFKIIYGFADISNSINKSIRENIKQAINGQEKIKETPKLISSSLAKNSFEDNHELYKFLNKMIIPEKRPDNIEFLNEIGLFIGFDISEITDFKEEKDFKTQLHNLIKNTISQELNFIKEQINQNKIKRFSFNLYFLPFENQQEFANKFFQKLGYE